MDCWKDISRQIYTSNKSLVPFPFSSLNQSSSSFLKECKFTYWNVHNFDGPMQKTHRVIYFHFRDGAQYLILWQMERWNITETDFMYDETIVATFPTLSWNNSVTILLNNSALTKSSKVPLQELHRRTLVRPVNLSTFSKYMN